MNSPLASILAEKPVPGDEEIGRVPDPPSEPDPPVEPEPEPEPEPAKVTPKTLYLVQIERNVIMLRSNADEPIVAWEDLGTYEAQNQRQAVQKAMQAEGLGEGRFRAISETSARVHAPRMTQRFVWD